MAVINVNIGTHIIRRQRIWPIIFNHMIGSTTDATLTYFAKP
jgi:hypothetical protein